MRARSSGFLSLTSRRLRLRSRKGCSDSEVSNRQYTENVQIQRKAIGIRKESLKPEKKLGLTGNRVLGHSLCSCLSHSELVRACSRGFASLTSRRLWLRSRQGCSDSEVSNRQYTENVQFQLKAIGIRKESLKTEKLD